MVEALRWRVTVSKLGDSKSECTLEVGAANWVAALRAARVQLGQEGGVPHGASCAVDPEGIVTVLAPTSRQRFIVARVWPHRGMTQGESTVRIATRHSADPLETQRSPGRSTAHAVTRPDSASHTASGRSPVTIPEHGLRPADDGTAAGAPAGRGQGLIASTFKPRGRRQRLETVAYMTAPDTEPSPPPVAATRPSTAPASSDQAAGDLTDTPVRRRDKTGSTPSVRESVSVGARSILRLITERNEDPSVDNPLTYRERAYAIAPGITLAEAEDALRESLSELATQLAHVTRGKFVNLAVFDHSWSDLPKRPPLMVLEWRDWRGDASVHYPATSVDRPSPRDEEAEAERLAQLFEALRDLPHMRSASAAMDLALELLSIAIPCEASAACLYDINTDELRFVAVRGHHALAQQGTAIRLGKGLIGNVALREGEPTASTYRSPDTEQTFDPTYDARPGLSVRSLLLRPLRAQGQLVGILQLINRGGALQTFTDGDINLANYVGTRLGDTLTVLRASVPPEGPSR